MEGLSGDHHSQRLSTDNHAFDEYREETLRRLEDERNEFSEFLARLRMAKDRVEFDEFMGSRSARTSVPSTGTASEDVVQEPQH